MKHVPDYHFMWLIPFVCFLCGYFAMSFIFSTPSLLTPALVGKNLQHAFQELSQSSITLRLLATKQESDIPDGTILSQKPLPGQAMKPNQSIYIVIATKPPVPQAPDIREKPIDSAILVCQKNAIRLKQYPIESRYPSNRCIAQHPQPHQPLPNHHMITYVSQGSSKPVLWPNFKGKSLHVALEFLENYGITPEVTHTKQVLDENPLITDQRPLAGSLLHMDSSKSMRVQLKV